MKQLLTVFFICSCLSLFAQSAYVPLNKDYYHLIDRFEIKNNGIPRFFHTTVKPYERKAIIALLDTLNLDSTKISKADQFNLSYLRNDSWEWSEKNTNQSKKPVLKYFYQKKSDFYNVSTPDFDLHVNPVLYLSMGKESNSTQKTFINTRGVELRGMINRKIGFYAFVADNQARFPLYVQNYANIRGAVPGEGYTKPFKINGYDFLTARGYFTFSITKNIQFQFGHDKNFIGNGYRSLILSDNSSNYTFLKLNTRVWKLNYENIFAEMHADVVYANKLLPKKYLAFHHLSLNVTKNFNIGIFESIVFGRKDSTKNGMFDFGYLNPVIFYRSIEQQNGSGDNAFIGIDYKLNFLRHFSFYGQIVLDEFLLKALKAHNGSWTNKQAAQVGIKYIDVAGISNLDLQVEGNLVRPYTYSHTTEYTNYAHYNQSLAHPLGANFYELIGILRYQPLKRLSFIGKLIYAKYGTDTSFTKTTVSDDRGGNILKSYDAVAHANTVGNKIGQGISNTLTYLSFTATYQIRHNLFIDFIQVIRTDKKSYSVAWNPQLPATNFTSVSLRWNIAQRLQEF